VTEPLVWAALILSVAALGFALWAVLGARGQRGQAAPDPAKDPRWIDLPRRLETLEQRVDDIAGSQAATGAVASGPYRVTEFSPPFRTPPRSERNAGSPPRSERATGTGSPRDSEARSPAMIAAVVPLAQAPAESDSAAMSADVPRFATLMEHFNAVAADVRGLGDFEKRWQPIAAAAAGGGVRASADGKLWIVSDGPGPLHALLPGTVRDWEKFYHGKLGTAASDLLGDYYAIADGPVLSLQRIAVVRGELDGELSLVSQGALSGT